MKCDPINIVQTLRKLCSHQPKFICIEAYYNHPVYYFYDVEMSLHSVTAYSMKRRNAMSQEKDIGMVRRYSKSKDIIS